MKKIIFVTFLVLIQTLASVAPAFAVWPPDTSTNESAGSIVSQRDLPPFDRLEQDQKRLADVVRDLKQDEEDLKRLTTKMAVPEKNQKQK